MAMRANYRWSWAGEAWKKITSEATLEGLRDIGRRVAEHAKELSPYDTGHNRSSIAVVHPSGRIEKRGRSRGGNSFTDAAGMITRGEMAVVTSSGYGGYLEIGARAARYTKKGRKTGKNRQHITSGGKRGSYYITRAGARVLQEEGQTEAALQTAFAVRAKRAEIRQVRASK